MIAKKQKAFSGVCFENYSTNITLIEQNVLEAIIQGSEPSLERRLAMLETYVCILWMEEQSENR